jgi:hypothetical protein
MRTRTPKAATLALLAFANLIGALDQYIVVVALPEIGRDLGYSAQSLQSVISAYASGSCSRPRSSSPAPRSRDSWRPAAVSRERWSRRSRSARSDAWL